LSISLITYMTKLKSAISPKLSIVILNHDTKKMLSDCLSSVKRYLKEVSAEVIVSDNASTDGSVRMIRNKFPWVRLIEGPNIGFANGNNRVKNMVLGEYVLFLNSDTIVLKDAFGQTTKYLDSHENVGAITCKLLLANGNLDKDVRRRFPTPWISFNRLFLKNGKRYWYEDVSPDTVHEVDAIQGAFFLTRKKLLDRVGWLDERYIWNGEDIDLSFQIKKLGYKIIYYPKVSIIHLKGATVGKIKNTSHKIDPALKLARKMEAVNSMEKFYRKNLWPNYPLMFNYFVLCGIFFLKALRYIQFKFKK